MLSAKDRYSIYNSKTKAFISQEKEFDMVNVLTTESEGQNIKTLENGNILLVGHSSTAQGQSDNYVISLF